jgi:hypothetical protein
MEQVHPAAEWDARAHDLTPNVTAPSRVPTWT